MCGVLFDEMNMKHIVGVWINIVKWKKTIFNTQTSWQTTIDLNKLLKFNIDSFPNSRIYRQIASK